MKILYSMFSLAYPAGVERIITRKANALVSMGHEVYIVTSDQKDQPRAFPLDERVKHIDLAIDSLKYVNTGRWKRYWYGRKVAKVFREKLTKVLMEIRPDIAIETGAGAAGFLWDIQDGSKKLLEFHYARNWRLYLYPESDKIGRAFAGYKLWEFRNTAKHYDKFITLTKEDAEDYGDMPNIGTIPNCNSFESDEVSTLENKIVLACGRFMPQKNFAELIDIWSMVSPKHPDWVLKIVGGGYLEDELKAQVSRLCLEKTVQILPSTDKVIDYYREASIFAFTSIFEGFGLVLTEAQTLGVPAVSYDCKCGPRDIILQDEEVNQVTGERQAGAGFLVPAGNKELFAQSLIELMENEPLRKRMGAIAKESSKRFTESVVMAQWEKLFGELLQK